MLALAGLPVLPELLPGDPQQAAHRIAAAAPTEAPDPSFVLTAVEGGAELTVRLPRTPQDLRAVRSGDELTLQTAGTSRRVRARDRLGGSFPGEISAAADGLVLARFTPSSDRPGGQA